MRYIYRYIARTIVKWLARSVPCRDQRRCSEPEVQKVYCAVEFVSMIETSKLVAVEVESRS